MTSDDANEDDARRRPSSDVIDELASLFLDEDYANRRRVVDDASTSKDDANTPARRGGSSPLMRSSSATTPARRTAPPATVRGWFSELWRSLLAEDDDEWADARRGRGGTPTGARAIENIDLGMEQEMEVVLRKTATPASSERLRRTSSSFGNRRRSSGSGGGGYFFGDDEDEIVRSSSSSSDEEVSSRFVARDLPDVVPGKKVMTVGEGVMDEIAAEWQRLWGAPNAFVTADDCRRAVRSLAEAKVVCAAMDERLEAWVVKTRVRDADGEMFDGDDLLEYWRRRAKDMCEVFLKTLVNVGGRLESCSTTPKHRDSLLRVVEGYVTGGVQRKLFKVGIHPKFAREDEFTAIRLEQLASLPIDALGLEVERYAKVVDDEDIIASLSSLGDLSSPSHMATRLVDVSTRIRQAGGDEDDPMNADDLLLVLLALVARAKPERAYSLVRYVETFHALVSNAHKGEEGFALANFSGAVRYARGDACGAIIEKSSTARLEHTQ